MACKKKEEKPVYDPLRSVDYRGGINKENKSRDVYFSAMSRDIVRNNRATQIMKYIFFAVVCAVLIGVCAVGLIVILRLSLKPSVRVEDLGVAAAAFGGVLTSILVLPKIIANHLFPQNSEQIRFDFIRSVQKMDFEHVVEDEQSIEWDGVPDKIEDL